MNPKMTKKLNVYLEVGNRRTFAAAVDWPGWCRSGKDEATALQALFEYGPRYARILRSSRLGFLTPRDASFFTVIERLKGNATTDFGAPDRPLKSDSKPFDKAELRRVQAILKACWREFDKAVEHARGKKLRSGPRGGGRTVDGIVQHVLGAEEGYLSQLGGKVAKSESSLSPMEQTRKAILNTLASAERGEIASHGPRGGKRWPARYFVRREAWHVLDHVWEIEDRLKKVDK